MAVCGLQKGRLKGQCPFFIQYDSIKYELILTKIVLLLNNVDDRLTDKRGLLTFRFAFNFLVYINTYCHGYS